jgi:hypothetical protein
MFAAAPLEPDLHLPGLALMMDRDADRRQRVRPMRGTESLDIKVAICSSDDFIDDFKRG